MESVTVRSVDARGSNAYPNEMLRLPFSLRWKAAVHPSGAGMPLKWGDAIIVTDNVYEERPSGLYCLDAGTGTTRWRVSQAAIGISDPCAALRAE